MSLASYEPLIQKIEFKNGEFSVRGLSAEDITALIQAHFTDIDQIFDTWTKHTQNVFTTDALQDFSMKIVRDVPILSAKIIAMAAGEIDMVDKVRMLPFPIQLEAFLTILQLTFEEVGGVGKFFERLGPTLRKLLPSSAIESLGNLAKERQTNKRKGTLSSASITA